MTENWRPIAGYEGSYEVSDRGRVRSLKRVTSHGHVVKSRLLTAHASPTSAYLGVNLYRDQRASRHTVHRLVLTAFTGAPPAGMEARHRNGDPLDNRLTNLVWGTHRQNMQDQRGHRTHKNTVKTHCPQGHPYDGDNLWVEKAGTRRCATCRRESWRRLSARRTAQRNAAKQKAA